LKTGQAGTISIDKAGALPVFSLAGGSWAGYRALSEQVTDQLLSLLGKQRKANTRQIPLGGGKDYPLVGLAQVEYIKQVVDATGLSKLQPKRLFERYGTRAMEIARYLRAANDQSLKSRPDWTRCEVEFLIEREKAVHVDDLRRSTLARLGQVSQPLVEELGEILAEHLGWTVDQKKAELNRTIDLLKERHGLVF
jgi:glycerol-3-phosphate dehydrogenase